MSRSINLVRSTFAGLVVLAGVASIAGPSARAVTITSNDFSLGYGYASGSWNDSETSGVNTGVIGDFTLLVTFDPNTAFTGGAGLTFPSRVLTGGGPGSSQGRSSTFGVTLTANYTGALPPGSTTLVIDNIRIHAGNYNSGTVTNTDTGGTDLINWTETTPGNLGASSMLDLGAASSDASLVSNYDQLNWNPVEVMVPGLTSTRIFALGTNGDLNAYLEGFEVFGHIEFSPPFIPEPSTGILASTLIVLGVTRRRRTARRTRR